MKTFIASIIPKIQEYSRKLDDITLLTNQHWVLIDDIELSKTIFIFKTSNELLVATNGIVEKGKWEYLGNQSLLIDLQDKSFLFKQGFFDENVLALKVDGKDEYSMLINENKFDQELNSISSVLTFLEQNYSKKNNAIFLKNDYTEDLEITDIIVIGSKRTFKMGRHTEYQVLRSDNMVFQIYRKHSNNKYFIYGPKEILLFPNKETCLLYILNNM
ncbi:hypothetical protein [Myroides pelagicus]|uniref:Uncharacterized protein n=1 Tax=Myroides pelagicus TaxID=270914 RepID=A0A7K1GHR5_9FLAO|nr:hypothetical protein [Myroides pelagicus]MTH28428.1 hypothetical protein [Myroides pelagicus]